MIAWWWLIPALLLGAAVGVVVMCLMQVAGRDDDVMEIVRANREPMWTYTTTEFPQKKRKGEK